MQSVLATVPQVPTRAEVAAAEETAAERHMRQWLEDGGTRSVHLLFWALFPYCGCVARVLSPEGAGWRFLLHEPLRLREGDVSRISLEPSTAKPSHVLSVVPVAPDAAPGASPDAAEAAALRAALQHGQAGQPQGAASPGKGGGVHCCFLQSLMADGGDVAVGPPSSPGLRKRRRHGKGVSAASSVSAPAALRARRVESAVEQYRMAVLEEDGHGGFSAFHGSKYCHFHSIARNGLSRGWAREDGLFGQGIYLSTDPRVAMGYVRYDRSAWPRARLGTCFGCLALCRVVRHPSVRVREPRGKSEAPDDIAEHYILVEHEEHVRVQHFLLFAKQDASGRSFHRLLLLILVYLVILAAILWVKRRRRPINS